MMMPVNFLKKGIHQLYLIYVDIFFIEKGKYRVGVLVDRIVGKAWYKVDDAYLLLSPLSVGERNFIAGKRHVGYDFVNQKIQNSLKKGGNFIDVGANIGHMSLAAANFLQGNGTVYSFEPSPREFKRLVANIKFNEFSNVQPINKGISKSREFSELYIAPLSRAGMNSKHKIVDKAYKKSISEFVPVHLVIDKQELSKVKCVKIDSEGDEVSVLKGFENVMNLLSHATFIVEITNDYLKKAGYQPEDVYNFFEKHNFTTMDGTRVKDYVQYDEVFISVSRVVKNGYY